MNIQNLSVLESFAMFFEAPSMSSCLNIISLFSKKSHLTQCLHTYQSLVPPLLSCQRRNNTPLPVQFSPLLWTPISSSLPEALLSVPSAWQLGNTDWSGSEHFLFYFRKEIKTLMREMSSWYIPPLNTIVLSSTQSLKLLPISLDQFFKLSSHLLLTAMDVCQF